MNVLQDLAKNHKHYDFTQAIRLLHSLSKQQKALGIQSPSADIRLKAEAMPYGLISDITNIEQQPRYIQLTIAKQALSGIYGVVPSYIYEEMLSAIHQENNALRDFLDVFNHRHLEMMHLLETRKWLILENERVPDKIKRLLNLGALSADQDDYFQYTLLLSQKTRNINVLKRVLNDYFCYEIDVNCLFHERKQLPRDSLTQLRYHESGNNSIGHGFLLGKTCLTFFSRLNITITPKNANELTQIQTDAHIGNKIRELIQLFTRDNTPIFIYLNVKRSYIKQPMLSSNAYVAAHLGEVDCLSPERQPEKMMKLLLK
ncbi:type VI secretion system baseplate subunit TssG [Vibrio sp.]|nr:type VI secretion system baseplate subunit TssG [Vibrio sp.]